MIFFLLDLLLGESTSKGGVVLLPRCRARVLRATWFSQMARVLEYFLQLPKDDPQLMHLSSVAFLLLLLCLPMLGVP
jgi:hypothetical protein